MEQEQGLRRFAGKLAVITGAAGDIGTATALRLASEGARVLAVDRDAAGVDRTVAALREAGATAEGTVADVTSAADVGAYAAAGRELGDGKIDLFFNNAGVEGPAGAVVELDDEAFDSTMAVNVRGVYLGLKHVIPAMGPGGAIVNTGSTGSLFGTPGMAAYVASKHAVLGLTRSVAKEVAASGIRVNAICPGPVDGRMMRAIEDGLGTPETDAHTAFAASIPLGRYSDRREVAALVAFLLSRDASYITGAAYTVDGGQRA